MSDDKIYKAEMSENFKLFRRKIQFFDCESISIMPLIEQLSFIKNKKSWGFPFRFGFFEIDQNDFLYIAKKMIDETLLVDL